MVPRRVGWLWRNLGGVLQSYLAFLFYIASGDIVARDVLLFQVSFIQIIVDAVNDFRIKRISATAYVGDVVKFSRKLCLNISGLGVRIV